jgi:hypothetical protein
MQKPGLFGMNGFLLFLLTCCSFALQAQQAESLILIDAENKLPFTVRIGDQLFASSSHGHLVIAHLKDSSYKLNFRFPKKELAEQVFPVVVKQKDQGLQLQGSESTWVLYNWQTKATIHPVRDRDSSRILEMGIKREDGFSKLMAAVVDDTAVMYNTYSGNWFTKDSLKTLPPTVVSSAQPVASNAGQNRQSSNKSSDSSVGKTSQPITNQPLPVPIPPGGQNLKQPTANSQPPTAINQPPTANSQLPTANRQLPTANSQPPTANSQLPTANSQPQTAKRPAVQPGIKKLREINLKISRKIVFLDAGPDGQLDTVTLFVFFENGDSAKKRLSGALLAKKKPASTDSAAVATIQSKTSGADIFVPGCGEQATTADLEWLRSAILKANSEQDKIAAASAAFALKCFSVSQLRVLASLLVSDKARYHLMEAAHLHISDHDHFRELADMYTDKNFQKKFLILADKRS